MLIPSGNGRDGGSRVMTSHSNHGNRGEACLLADFLFQDTDLGAGLDDRTEDLGIDTKTLKKRPVEVPCTGIDKTGGRRVRVLTDPFASQHVRQEVRHEEDLLGLVDR